MRDSCPISGNKNDGHHSGHWSSGPNDSGALFVLQLQSAGDEMVELRFQCQQYSQQLSTLRSQVETMETDYRQLADRSKKVCVVQM